MGLLTGNLVLRRADKYSIQHHLISSAYAALSCTPWDPWLCSNCSNNQRRLGSRQAIQRGPCRASPNDHVHTRTHATIAHNQPIPDKRDACTVSGELHHLLHCLRIQKFSRYCFLMQLHQRQLCFSVSITILFTTPRAKKTCTLVHLRYHRVLWGVRLHHARVTKENRSSNLRRTHPHTRLQRYIRSHANGKHIIVFAFKHRGHGKQLLCVLMEGEQNHKPVNWTNAWG